MSWIFRFVINIISNFIYFNRWDEWVPEERVVKHNEANLVRQKQLKDTYSSKKKKPAKTGHKFEDQSKDSDFSESSLKRQGGNVRYMVDKNKCYKESENF